jgi:hypothetical protein
MKYDIHVYNSSGTLLRVLGVIQSARYRLAENDIGDWDVTVAWKDDSIPLLLSPPNRVEFYRDGAYVFGGIIRRQSSTQDGKVPFYTVGGPSYMQWLADARLTSATGTGDVPFVADNLDDIMKAVVRAHVLDTSTDFVCAADSGLSTVNEAYTGTGYQTVLETLQGIAVRAKDTTFDIIRDIDGALRFRTWTPSRGPDRSKGTASPVLFDLRGGNLIDAEWVRDGNKVVNALRGGGPGDKASRYVYPATGYSLNSQSILDWGRIEGFIDAGSETTANTDKKVIEELAKQSEPEESVSFRVAPYGRYTLGTHFDFGTKVTVLWLPILEFTDTIRGLEVRLDSGQSLAQVDINVGDTLTGDAATRASITFGRFLRDLRRTISVQTRH